MMRIGTCQLLKAFNELSLIARHNDNVPYSVAKGFVDVTENGGIPHQNFQKVGSDWADEEGQPRHHPRKICNSGEIHGGLCNIASSVRSSHEHNPT